MYGDAQMYLESARFNRPGTFPLRFQAEVRDGCPSDCRLCPDHKQHACLGLIEVNTRTAWTARSFRDSGHQPIWLRHHRGANTLVAAEGEPGDRWRTDHPQTTPRVRRRRPGLGQDRHHQHQRHPAGLRPAIRPDQLATATPGHPVHHTCSSTAWTRQHRRIRDTICGT